MRLRWLYSRTVVAALSSSEGTRPPIVMAGTTRLMTLTPAAGGVLRIGGETGRGEAQTGSDCRRAHARVPCTRQRTTTADLVRKYLYKNSPPMPTLMHHTDLRERLLLRLTGALRPWPSSGRGNATVLMGGSIELGPPSLLARRVAAADSAKLAIAFQLLDLLHGKVKCGVFISHLHGPVWVAIAASILPATRLTCGCPPLPASRH